VEASPPVEPSVAVARAEAESPPPTGAARTAKRPRRRHRSNTRRALLALSAVAAAEIVGTVGLHVIEGANWVNAFYFESMLATGQGPPFPLNTDTGKIFASIMAFVSVGSTLSAVIFTLGPLLTRIWREFVEDVETDSRAFEHDVRRGVRRVEDEFR
jgi:hypothetical protein